MTKKQRWNKKFITRFGTLAIASLATTFVAVACASTSETNASKDNVLRQQLVAEANNLTIENFNYQGKPIDTTLNIANYHNKTLFSARDLLQNRKVQINNVVINGTTLTIKYILSSGEISTPELSFIIDTFNDERKLLKYLNDNLTLADIRNAVQERLATLNKRVADWNNANDLESLHISIAEEGISNLTYVDGKISYTLLFVTRLQGVTYTRKETINNKKLIISDDVQGSKQVGLEVELTQSNSRLVNIDAKATSRVNFLSANNFFKTFLEKTTIDDFEEDHKFVKNITINHTNDIHGRLGENAGRFNRYIGFGNIAAYYRTQRPDLALDGGDLIQGTGESNQDQGARAAQITSSVGIDVSALGNHEFDFGKDNLLNILKAGPFYSANVVFNETLVNEKGIQEVANEPLSPGTIIKTIKGDLEVGIIPLTTEDTAFKSNPRNIKNIRFRNIIEVAKEEVAKLKASGVNLIIVVGHIGDDPTSIQTSIQLAKAVPEIDLLIDGHSHQEYALNRQVNGVYLNQTGAFTQNIGEINFDFNRESGKITRYQNRYLDLEDFSQLKDTLDRNLFADGLVTEALEAFSITASENAFRFPYELAESINVGTDLKRVVRTFESSIGNFFADAMQWSVQTRNLANSEEKIIAVQNGGGIRASLIPDSNKENFLTKGDILRVSPFNNSLTAVDIDGLKLREMFNLAARKWQDGGFLQVSKDLEVTYDLATLKKGETDRQILERNVVREIKYKGVAIKDTDKFVLVINDFLRAGGDQFNLFVGLNERVSGDLLSDVLIAYGKFLESANSTSEFNSDLYQEVFSPPSRARRIKINGLNQAALDLLAMFEKATA